MKHSNLIEARNNSDYKNLDFHNFVRIPEQENVKPAKQDKTHNYPIDGGKGSAINLYLKELRAYPLLTRQEEVHYGRLSRKGDKESKNKMIVCNLRLVLKIARKYLYTGIDFMDLVEEGNLGLIHAVEKYDPEKGFRFSTYATWWIRQNIERAIMNQKHVVRLPIHVQKEYNSFKKRMRENGKEFRHSGSAGEISDLLQAPVERVRQVIEWNERSFSMVSHDENGDESNNVEFLSDDGNEEPSHILELADENYRLKLNQAKINDRDREILSQRFGLEGSKPKTLGEIGDAYGISRERVRQIIQEVIIKMREDYCPGQLHS